MHNSPDVHEMFLTYCAVRKSRQFGVLIDGLDFVIDLHNDECSKKEI